MARNAEESEDREEYVFHRIALESADERHQDSVECWCKPQDLGIDPGIGVRVFYHRVLN